MDASRQLLVGFDGSPSAANAITVGAKLLPGRSAGIVHLWAPPFLDPQLRGRLWPLSRNMDEFAALVEHEGQAEAERRVADGMALAAAAGWDAEPLVPRTYGDRGFELARLAERHGPEALVVGSRGLGGARALLGSTSDSAVHYSPVPVLVVPNPLLVQERQAIAEGPVVVGSDGSTGARVAQESARSMFAERSVDVVQVTSADEDADPDATAVRPKGVLQSARAVADALAEQARARDAAVLVVGSRGRSARQEVLLGSVAKAVLHHAHRPVLVVPSRA